MRDFPPKYSTKWRKSCEDDLLNIRIVKEADYDHWTGQSRPSQQVQSGKVYKQTVNVFLG
jgi:hypothetical protein